MSMETEAYIERLDYLRNEVVKSIQGMSEKELNWAPPASDTNSSCVLATHITGSERYWVHQIAGGIDVGRNREGEFFVRAGDSGELEAALLRTGETTRQVLSALSSEDLDGVRAPGPGATPVSGRYGVLHALEHIGQHLGHLSLTRQLYAASERE